MFNPPTLLASTAGDRASNPELSNPTLYRPSYRGRFCNGVRYLAYPSFRRNVCLNGSRKVRVRFSKGYLALRRVPWHAHASHLDRAFGNCQYKDRLTTDPYLNDSLPEQFVTGPNEAQSARASTWLEGNVADFAIHVFKKFEQQTTH